MISVSDLHLGDWLACSSTLFLFKQCQERCPESTETFGHTFPQHQKSESDEKSSDYRLPDTWLSAGIVGFICLIGCVCQTASCWIHLSDSRLQIRMWIRGSGSVSFENSGEGGGGAGIGRVSAGEGFFCFSGAEIPMMTKRFSASLVNFHLTPLKLARLQKWKFQFMDKYFTNICFFLRGIAHVSWVHVLLFRSA